MTPQGAIAHYRLTSKLGEGGMGAVYRAADTKLGRDVAIKVLPDFFADDPDRLARFKREAQVLASLNHPNIAAIYGVEERALVLELVEGPTLADRIAQGPIAFEEALPLIHQLVDALEYAHEKGVVHRDLKPANIKVTPDGRLKVLDFGLAKALASEDAPAANPANSPTLTMRATMAGAIMGTAAYMSPEQARGQTVDRRADIWAFGVVVYEMLTGRALFEAPTVSDTLAAVLTREPQLSTVPARARRLLELCLTRDHRQRMRDISGARIALEQPAAAPAQSRRPSRVPIAVAAATTLIAIGVSAALWRATRTADRPLTRLNVDLGPNSSYGPDTSAVISRDGNRIAFLSRQAEGFQLATRSLDQAHPTVLPGTVGANSPFLSPDGQWIAFFANRKLRKVSVHGGTPVDLCEIPIGRGGWWGDDGTIVASDSNALFSVSESGGVPRKLTTPGDAETQRWPQILPGGAAVLFTALTSAAPDYEDANIAVVAANGGPVKLVQRGGYFGRYVPSGHLLYLHQGTLFAVPFDLSKLETRGSPVPVLDDVGSNASWGSGNLDLSQNGTLVYLSGKYELVRPHVWMDSAGTTAPLNAPPGIATRISPDGSRVALTTLREPVVVYDVRTDATQRLTFSSAAEGSSPVWAPDSKHIVYDRRPNSELVWTRADGGGQPHVILKTPGNPVPGSFSPDGRRLVYNTAGATTSRDIWVLPLDLTDPERPKPGTPEPIVESAGADVDPRVSPDGRWLAYSTNESGSHHTFVRAFGGSGMWQISPSPGRFPVWSRRANELFYQALDGIIMVVPYTTEGGTFTPGKPRMWADIRLWMTGNLPNFDLHPDGKRFAVALVPRAGASAHVTFLLNFFDELRRRIPTGQ
jgi:serine/threonine-protein kinase